ncbi:MAG: hypothetical protein K0U93_26265, partial [Gammaproteobacteria bacterium]|nr:hypothetical protein [Gammaproteobacteria bacterium]
MVQTAVDGGSTLADLKQNLASAMSQLQGAKAENAGLQSLVGSLQDDLAATVTEIASLKDQLAQAKAAVQDAQSQGTNMDGLVGQLRADLADRVTEMGRLKDKVASLTGALSTSEGEGKSLKDVLAELKAEVASKTASLKSAGENLRVSKSESDALRGTLAQRDAAYAAMTKERDDLTVAHTKLGEQRDGLATSLETTKAELTAKTTEATELAANVESQKSAGAELKTEVDSLTDELAKAAAKLTDTETSLATAEKRAGTVATQRNGFGVLLVGAIIGIILLWRRGSPSA